MLQSCLGTRISGDIAIHLSPVDGEVSTIKFHAIQIYRKSTTADTTVGMNSTRVTTVHTDEIIVEGTAFTVTARALLAIKMKGIGSKEEKQKP